MATLEILIALLITLTAGACTVSGLITEHRARKARVAVLAALMEERHAQTQPGGPTDPQAAAQGHPQPHQVHPEDQA